MSNLFQLVRSQLTFSIEPSSKNAWGYSPTINQRKARGFILTKSLHLEIMVLLITFTLCPTHLFAWGAMDKVRATRSLLTFSLDMSEWTAETSFPWLAVGTYSPQGGTSSFTTSSYTLILSINLKFISSKQNKRDYEKTIIERNSNTWQKSNEES